MRTKVVWIHKGLVAGDGTNKKSQVIHPGFIMLKKELSIPPASKYHNVVKQRSQRRKGCHHVGV